jgi:transposase InsO family protein
MTRQLLAAFPWDRAPRYLLRDRDACYGKEFHDATGWLGIREVLTAPRSPWQNPFVERLIGTIRRECLDHVIVLHEPGLRRVLKSYFEYYERTRTHCLSIRMLRSLGVYNLRSSERWWSFRRSADSITDMNAGQPSLPGAVLFYN